MAQGEGTRRLALLVGAIGIVSWWVFVLIDSTGLKHVSARGWWVIWIGSVFCFLIPWMFVHGISWVRDGYTKNAQVDRDS